MRSPLFALLFISSLPLPAQPAQNNQRPRAPIIPNGISETERLALTQSALALARGRFDEVAARIKPLMLPADAQVYADWAPVPVPMRAEYKQALTAAIRGWNEGLAGTNRLVVTAQEESADLRIFFEKSVTRVTNGQVRIQCADYAMESGLRRTGTARLALDVPYTDAPHTAASIGHLFAQAIGRYLGLQALEISGGAMGMDSHDQAEAEKPSDSEIRNARALQEARAKLLDLAGRRVVAYLPRPVLNVETPEVDAGDVERGEPAHFVFKLRNAGDAPLEVDARPNCGCTVAKFDKVIPAGSEGKVEADFHSAGYRGKVMKLISLTTNDPENGNASLRMLCNVRSIIDVLPAETAIIPLKSEGATVKEFEVRTSGKEAVDITHVTCSVPYAEAKLGPARAADGARSFALTVTIGPDAPLGRSAFIVTASTNSVSEPQVNITAICDKGILVVPISLYLGAIQPSTALPVTQIVTIMKSGGAFHLKRVSSDDLRLEVQQETVKEGSQYRLTVRYKGGWPVGAARSKILIDTDDAAQPHFEIPIMASVLAAAPANR